MRNVCEHGNNAGPLEHHVSWSWILIVKLLSRNLCKVTKLRRGTDFPSTEASSFSPRQEISCILWNQDFLYSFWKVQPLLHILSYMNPIHALLHFRPILILSSTLRPGVPAICFLKVFPTKPSVFFRLLITRVSHSA